ncbi:MAG: DUF6152 family protein [Gammaproteobacteria bacterium]|nr:DUF6152 family protein [Gammaproteobacteria bacterium]
MRSMIRLVCSLSVLLIPFSLYGHHAFDAEFDRESPIEFEGIVTLVQWSNPHARVYVDVVDENGDTANWNLELSSPNMYMRQGWSRNTLQEGEFVEVTGWRARNDPHVGNVGTIKKEDGQELFTRRDRGE